MDRYFPVTEIDIPLDSPDETTFTLGDAETGSLTSVNTKINNDVVNRINNLPSKSSILKEAQENATAILNQSTTGYVTIVHDDAGTEAIYITDTKDYTKAKKIWRWNLNGLAYSNDGGKTYGLAMTMDGQIVADYITTGTLSASRIKGGSLVLGGIDNVNGTIYIKDSKGVVRITEDVNGINVNDKFKVDMTGNIEAVSISGNAINQFNTLIQNSDAMKKANEAISIAQNAANTANQAANTANQAAQTAQRTANSANNTASSASNTASSASNTANSAYATAESVRQNIQNIYNTDSQQNRWISQLSGQLRNLGQPGIY
jgi:hypothetical protein